MLQLFLLFTLVPVIELMLLFQVGQMMGLGATVALVLLTGAVGAALARSEGLRVYLRWQEAIKKGSLPEDGVTDGLLILVGGVLLVTPGILTDIVGFSFVIPWTRKIVARVVRAWAKSKIDDGSVRVVQGGSVFSTRSIDSIRVQPRDPSSTNESNLGIIDAEGEESDFKVDP